MRGLRKARIQGQGGRYSVLALFTASFNLIAQSDKSAVTREGNAAAWPVALGAGRCGVTQPGLPVRRVVLLARFLTRQLEPWVLDSPCILETPGTCRQLEP